MITIYECDLDDLKAEGWVRGAFWSEPGSSGWYLRHPEYSQEWITVRITPSSDDSLVDIKGFIGPSGPANSATEALLDRIDSNQQWWDDYYT